MRDLSTAELLQLRELLQAETNSLAKIQAIEPLVEDDELKTSLQSGIQSCEARLKGIQQFIVENKVIPREVQ